MPIIKTREEYNALAALNYSGAKELLKSPAHYKAYLDAPREETKALRMGRLVHAIVLEADAVESRFLVIPGDAPKKPTKSQLEAKKPSEETLAAIGWWAKFNTDAEGKTILDAEEYQSCMNVAEAMRARIADLGLTITATELMLTVDYCGCPIKAAIDAVATDANGDEWLLDLKTTEDASPKAFLQTCRSYRYPLQNHLYRTAYHIQTGKRTKGFVFIAGEKSDTCQTASYQIGPELMAYAAMDFEQAVALYKGCVALDEWPGYAKEIVELDIPAKNAANPITFA